MLETGSASLTALLTATGIAGHAGAPAPRHAAEEPSLELGSVTNLGMEAGTVEDNQATASDATLKTAQAVPLAPLTITVHSLTPHTIIPQTRDMTLEVSPDIIGDEAMQQRHWGSWGSFSVVWANPLHSSSFWTKHCGHNTTHHFSTTALLLTTMLCRPLRILNWSK